MLKRGCKRRWSACGNCDACCREDCGDCINCMDKSKFGGQGIRKQCCVRCALTEPANQPTRTRGAAGLRDAAAERADVCHPQIHRRCERLNAESAGHSRKGSYGATAPLELEQQMFWEAVAGCMRLNGRGGEEAQSDDSGADGSRSPVESDQSDVSTPSTSSSSFCFKLAAALAADGRLAAQPIALRALQQAGALPEGMQLDASARDMLIECIAKADRDKEREDSINGTRVDAARLLRLNLATATGREWDPPRLSACPMQHSDSFPLSDFGSEASGWADRIEPTGCAGGVSSECEADAARLLSLCRAGRA